MLSAAAGLFGPSSPSNRPSQQESVLPRNQTRASTLSAPGQPQGQPRTSQSSQNVQSDTGPGGGLSWNTLNRLWRWEKADKERDHHPSLFASLNGRYVDAASGREIGQEDEDGDIFTGDGRFGRRRSVPDFTINETGPSRFQASDAGSDRDPPVPTVALDYKLYMLHTTLPWIFFLAAYLAFTFSVASMEGVPYMIAAALILLAALVALPVTPPIVRSSSQYSREDVVICTGFLCCTALFGFSSHTKWSGMGYMALIGAALVAIIVGEVRLRTVKRKNWLDTVPFWHCVLAVSIGSFAGCFNFSEHMLPYHHVAHGSEYINVLPQEKAEAYADFGKLIFAPEAKVDTVKSIGYKQRDTYCVAPVLEEAQTEVEFWVVGKGCCSSRGSFWCTASTAYSSVASKLASGAMSEENVHSPLDFWEQENKKGTVKAAVPFVERPFADGWNVYGFTEQDGFERARALAKELYHLTEAKSPRMVYLTSDPFEVQSNLLLSSWITIGLHSFVYLIVCIVLGFLGSFVEVRQRMLPMKHGR